MTIRWISLLAIVGSLISFAKPISCAETQAPTKYQLGFPHLKLRADERIVSIEIDITAGATTSAMNLPVGWHIAIDNDPSWQTTLKANTRVGTGSLTADDLTTVTLTITKHELEDLTFSVSAIVSVTADYNQERTIHLGSRDLVLTPRR